MNMQRTALVCTSLYLSCTPLFCASTDLQSAAPKRDTKAYKHPHKQSTHVNAKTDQGQTPPTPNNNNNLNHTIDICIDRTNNQASPHNIPFHGEQASSHNYNGQQLPLTIIPTQHNNTNQASNHNAAEPRPSRIIRHYNINYCHCCDHSCNYNNICTTPNTPPHRQQASPPNNNHQQLPLTIPTQHNNTNQVSNHNAAEPRPSRIIRYYNINCCHCCNHSCNYNNICTTPNTPPHRQQASPPNNNHQQLSLTIPTQHNNNHQNPTPNTATSLKQIDCFICCDHSCNYNNICTTPNTPPHRQQTSPPNNNQDPNETELYTLTNPNACCKKSSFSPLCLLLSCSSLKKWCCSK